MYSDKMITCSSINYNSIKGIFLLAFPLMKNMLLSELKNRFSIKTYKEFYGDLIYIENFNTNLLNCCRELPYFAKTAMLAPKIMKFNSIGEAAANLKHIQRNWGSYQYQFFRRAQLIQDKLPYIILKPRKFPAKIPSSPIGLYTLIDKNTMLFSEKTSSFLPAGEISFEEDHINPPSRAYLKLQEALTIVNSFSSVQLPCKGQHCFDAGASPGGWTWVLTRLGAEVFAVDRAKLAPPLMKDSLVRFRKHDAFTLKPAELGCFDWVFSDVICYPERLYNWICLWLESGLAKNMICTIKMQGETDWAAIKKFEELPESRVVHLNYNKHELTWIHTEKQSI